MADVQLCQLTTAEFFKNPFHFYLVKSLAPRVQLTEPLESVVDVR